MFVHPGLGSAHKKCMRFTQLITETDQCVPVSSYPVLAWSPCVLIVALTPAVCRKYYPERMGRLYIVNAPWSVDCVWLDHAR
jgi:hypothetical protein